MNKNTIYGSVLIVVLAVTAGFFLLHRDLGNQGPVKAVPAPLVDEKKPFDKTFSLVCLDKKAMNVTFHLPADTSIDLILSDSRKMTLMNDKNSENPRYFNADKSIVLSNTGQNLVLTENDMITYDHCILATQ